MSVKIDAEPQKYGQILKKYREQAKVTQLEIAEAAGLTKNYISSIERGVHKCNAATFIVYAKKCHISLDKMAGLEKTHLIPELSQLLSVMNEEQQQKVADIIKIMIR